MRLAFHLVFEVTGQILTRNAQRSSSDFLNQHFYVFWSCFAVKYFYNVLYICGLERLREE